MTRPGWAAAAACAAAVALGPGAGAARGDVLATAAGVSPSVVVYSQADAITWVTFKLRLRTGDREERFAVSVRGARYGGGSVLGRPDLPTFSGPARATFADISEGPTTCSPAPLIIRLGAEPGVLTQYVALGARSDVVVSARLPVAAAPWPGSRLQAVFTVTPRFVDDGGGAGPTDVTRQTVLSAIPRARLSRSGVRITLASRPQLGAVGPRDPYGRAYPRYRLGRTFAISGRTEPALPGRPIRLRVHGPDGRVETIAVVRPGPAGRFSYRWRPRQAGRNILLAQFESAEPAYARAVSCPVYALMRG